jgi:N-terminal domain of anti-restriction factor ArdC/IrrE N-terminal-like domain
MNHTDALDRLERGIQSLVNRDNWLNYLKTQATFHSYSFNNTCLILDQCPHASHIAGFQSWKKLNRSVKKGEKGIRILAPIVHKDRVREASPVGNRPDEIAGISFRSVSVFDISQTEGEPLPEIATKLSGDDNGVLNALKGFALGQGFTLKEEDLGEINGSCSYQSPIAITINPNRSRLHQAKTLAHELGHALLHCGENYKGHDSKSTVELEAESVAFITLHHFGIDAGDYSFGYIAGWNTDTADVEPVITQLKQSGASIQKAADRIIISGIEAQLETKMDCDLAA